MDGHRVLNIVSGSQRLMALQKGSTKLAEVWELLWGHTEGAWGRGLLGTHLILSLVVYLQYIVLGSNCRLVGIWKT